MSNARRDTGAEPKDTRPPLEVHAGSRGDDSPSAGPSPLVRLRRSALFLVACSLAGGLVMLGVALIRKPHYRAAATLLVVEPRGTSASAVDYQLTPIRSYSALLSSPALASACAEGRPEPRVSVRMPENTRLLEVTVEGEDPVGSAAFAGCLAAKAVEENRRLNAEVAQRGEALVAGALETARTEVAARQGELSRVRSASLVDLKRAEQKAALADVAAATEEERLARQRIDEEEARRASFEETARKGSAGRELAEDGSAQARADAAAARAAMAAATRARVAAVERAARLEREIAASDEQVERQRRRLDGAAAGLAELERRSALAPLDSAARAFDLQLIAPPPPRAGRVGPSPLLAGFLGLVVAAGLGALLVLSRPE